MSVNPIELRAVCRLSSGAELVKTGIYVLDTTTIKEIMAMMRKELEYNGETYMVTKVEFDVNDDIMPEGADGVAYDENGEISSVEGEE